MYYKLFWFSHNLEVLDDHTKLLLYICNVRFLELNFKANCLKLLIQGQFLKGLSAHGQLYWAFLISVSLISWSFSVNCQSS